MTCFMYLAPLLCSLSRSPPTQPGETVVVRSRSRFNDRPEYVPEGHVWLEGDNPSNSSDSRSYGPIPLAMVRGRVFFKVMLPRGWGGGRSGSLSNC